MSEPAGLDVRMPIGAFFLLLGVILAVYSLATGGAATASAAAEAPTTFRIDLWWGIVMALFGAVMLGLALRHRARIAHGT